MTSGDKVKKCCFALICCFLLLYLFPSSSAAHARILKSTPVQDSELKESPQEIRVQFSEEIDLELSRLFLYDERGNQLVTTQTTEKDNWLLLNIPALDNGIYKVVWQILSVDTHVTEGSFLFTVSHDPPSSPEKHAPSTGPTETGAKPPEPTVDPVIYNEAQNSSGALPGMPLTGAVQANASPLNGEQTAVPMNNEPLSGQKNWNLGLRIVEIIAAVFIAGYVFARTWIFRSKEYGIAAWFSSKIEQVVISVAVLLFLLAGSAHVYLLSKQFSGSTIYQIIGDSSLGQASWIRPLILVCLLLTVLSKQNRIRTSIQFMLLGVLMLTFPLTGHAVTGNTALVPVLTHTLHMLAAAVWFGGLLGLFSLSFMNNKDAALVGLLNHLLIRFSAVALPMFVVVTLSGVVLSLYRLHSWSDLFKSAYGQILLCKVAVVLLTFLVAGFHRFIMLPRIKHLVQDEIDRSRAAAGKLFYGIQAEMVLAVVLLILAGVLSTGPPP